MRESEQASASKETEYRGKKDLMYLYINGSARTYCIYI